MKIAIRAIGNSKGAVFPAALLKELNINIGDQLEAVAENGRLVITPTRKPRFQLNELLAQCDHSAPMPAEVREWDGMVSVGNER
jgi:antitoxin component of MazEF toxin-antitoxin module